MGSTNLCTLDLLYSLNRVCGLPFLCAQQHWCPKNNIDLYRSPIVSDCLCWITDIIDGVCYLSLCVLGGVCSWLLPYWPICFVRRLSGVWKGRFISRRDERSGAREVKWAMLYIQWINVQGSFFPSSCHAQGMPSYTPSHTLDDESAFKKISDVLHNVACIVLLSLSKISLTLSVAAIQIQALKALSASRE